MTLFLYRKWYVPSDANRLVVPSYWFITNANKNFSHCVCVCVFSTSDPLLRDYWVYEGSLTTPPCSENVTWILFRYPLTISQMQVSLAPHASFQVCFRFYSNSQFYSDCMGGVSVRWEVRRVTVCVVSTNRASEWSVIRFISPSCLCGLIRSRSLEL